jgi:uncharacterized protein (DUF1330 family)
MTTDSTQEQIDALMKGPAEGSIRMLNMLKFKQKAEYADGSDGGCDNGMQAYIRYSVALHKEGILAAAGAKLVFSEGVAQGVIGDSASTDFDIIAIMQYPCRQAFLNMISSPEYQAAHVHREAGLERQLLICCAGNDPS